jgi:enamine deaminase RidA (YjgF/YER057c/UK114 family)
MSSNPCWYSRAKPFFLAALSLFTWWQWQQTSKRDKLTRFDVDKRFTNAISYGNTIYMSGQVGEGKTIEEQTRSALSEIDKALASAGSDKSNILELTIWLSDMARDYNTVNAIYDTWITPGKPPTRACVQAKLYSEDCYIEIRCIAAKTY